MAAGGEAAREDTKSKESEGEAGGDEPGRRPEVGERPALLPRGGGRSPEATPESSDRSWSRGLALALQVKGPVRIPPTGLWPTLTFSAFSSHVF